MPTPRAFAGWRSLSRSGPTSDVPCRSIGTFVSIPCSTRELSSCLRTFVLDVAHFRLRPAPLDCVRRDSPTRARARLSKTFLREIAPLARNACRRIALPSLCSLGLLFAEDVFTTSAGFPRASCDGMDSDARLRPRTTVSRTPLPPRDCTPLPRQRPRSSEWLDRPSFTIAREEFDPRYVRSTTATDTADTRTHASYGYRTRRGCPRAFDAPRVFTTRNALPRLDSFHPTAFSSVGEAMFSAGSTTHGRVVPSSPLLTFPSPRLRTCDPLRNACRSDSAKVDSIAHS